MVSMCSVKLPDEVADVVTVYDTQANELSLSSVIVYVLAPQNPKMPVRASTSSSEISNVAEAV